MKISYRWLQQYIPIGETPEETGARLTATGLEVESIDLYEPVKGGLRGLVIGEVLTCSRHPNADKLFVTTVDVGAGTPLPVVCGAANVAAGQKVVVALPGTTLYPHQGQPLTINSAKIRGAISEGMICAEDEMGMGSSHDGIMVLNTDLPNGTPAAQFFRLETDYIFEIGLTPNRADAASHIGVARDLKAVTGLPIQWPDVTAFRIDNTDRHIPVTVEHTEACPRYSAVTLSGITVRPSPSWLQNRLKSIGLTPINNVVDATNFVLHEMGQPLHAFDADKIAGGRVTVKILPADTPFVTLDGKERRLTGHDLMICNGLGEGLCIAGVFGGLHSGVTAETQNIFLESACFSPAYIRKTAIHHQLKTDASFRFERGTDPNLTVFALQRAALLIKELAGGHISSEVTDVYPHKAESRKLVVKEKNIDRLIGKKIERKQKVSILERLDIAVSDQTPETFTVSVPPYRAEVTSEADIAEEILRIYGFNNIELREETGTGYLAAFPAKDIERFRETMSHMLAGSGYFEIMTNSLTSEAWHKKNKLNAPGSAIEILNKLSEDQGVLRQTLVFSGLEVCAHNIRRRQKDLKLFEFGKVYWKEGAGYREAEKLALFLSGNRQTENWQNPTRLVRYHDLAQAVAHVLKKCALAADQTPLAQDDVLEYGMIITANEKPVGKIGKVKAALARDFGLKQEVFYAELDVEALFAAASPAIQYQEVPRFPEVRRDLSLVIDEQVSFARIEALVKQTESRLIREVIAFDVYQGDKIPPGKKAYALGFTLYDEMKTLTDEEIDAAMNRLMAAFEIEMQAVIRR
jgi:phenylalanyl-tRNA synthetase beta chain